MIKRDNSGQFTERQWERLERPLFAVDTVLRDFAVANGLEVTLNHKDWPERSVRWVSNNVQCIIQIYLASEEQLTFNLWLCASQDRGRERYWKNELRIENKPISEFAGRLPQLLGDGRETLLAWSNEPSVMDYAVSIDEEPPAA